MSEIVINCMPGEDAYNLKRRYQSLEKRGEIGWDSFPHFLLWAKKTGYFKNAFLRRYDKEAPYGPDNCYWSRMPEVNTNVARTHKPSSRSSFCTGCTKRKRPDRCSGCEEWEAWFVENWNRNIYRGAPEKPVEESEENCAED